jgi:uncharacterized repeat protein (TIGR01451 family)
MASRMAAQSTDAPRFIALEDNNMQGVLFTLTRFLGLASFALFLTACGGGGSGSSGSSSATGLKLSITDAPVQDADIAAVVVRFTQVIVHSADGTKTTYNVEDNSDPANIKPYRDIDLKSLVSGKSMLLGEIPLDAGDYDWVRLVIDPDHSYVEETNGGEYLVKCPSCTQSGFKLNRSFTIDTTGWIDFTIDFDLRKSITLTHPNALRADYDYILRPTLRILDTTLASSYIHGTVTDQRSEKTNPDTPDACWVYVYQGDAAAITPDDICNDPDTSICPAADRPLLETPVTFDGGSGQYVYNTGYIYPGTYTVALVCQADDPLLDDDLLFMDKTGVQADAVPGGAPQDLALVNVPVLSLQKTLDANADEDASGSVTAGDTLTFRMHLANDGNLTLTDTTLSDPLPGLSALNCTDTLPAALAPGATLDCTADYVVQADDMPQLVNTATATADQAGPVDSTVTVDVVSP